MTAEHVLHILARIVIFGLVLTGIWKVIEGIRSSEFHAMEPPQIVTLVDDEKPEPIEEVEEPEPVEIEEEYFEPVPELPDAAVNDLPDQIDNLLGIDADASGGFDQFGLVAKRGGRSLIDTKDAAIAADIARMQHLVEQKLQQALEQQDRLKKSNYTVLVKFWINAAGFVDNVIVSKTTGNRELDQVIRQAILELPAFSQTLAKVPQPVRVQISARGASG